MRALVAPPPAPLDVDVDADRDGLADALEDEWAARFAPMIVLDRGETCRPSSVSWLAAEIEVDRASGSQPAVRAASALGGGNSSATLSPRVRVGAASHDDWQTYVHVFARADGGFAVQYWFYYPYNDGPLVFDHESDWEHVTVRLDSSGRPDGMYAARHEDNAPGRFRAWEDVRRSGDHPIVLSARGSHASYFDADDAAWFESVTECSDVERCPTTVWRTWQGGGLSNVGERARPRHFGGPSERALMVRADRWGATGQLPGTSAPVGPLFQRGFCHAAHRSCLAPVAKD
jgi:hypothetical protein